MIDRRVLWRLCPARFRWKTSPGLRGRPKTFSSRTSTSFSRGAGDAGHQHHRRWFRDHAREYFSRCQHGALGSCCPRERLTPLWLVAPPLCLHRKGAGFLASHSGPSLPQPRAQIDFRRLFREVLVPAPSRDPLKNCAGPDSRPNNLPMSFSICETGHR